MAVRGAEEKQIVFNKILETFKGSFVNDKEIRIPMNDVEIKIVITCAKEVIGGGSVASTPVEATASAFPTPTAPATKTEVTDEEKQRLKNLLAQMF